MQQLAEIAQRRGEALALLARGCTYEMIANQLGYYDRAAAQRDCSVALKNLPAPNVEQLRQSHIEKLARLEAMLSVPLGSTKKDKNGRPTNELAAPELDIKRVHGVLKVMERVARLCGLDAPTRLEHSGGLDFAPGVLENLSDSDLAAVANGKVPAHLNGIGGSPTPNPAKPPDAGEGHSGDAPESKAE